MRGEPSGVLSDKDHIALAEAGKVTKSQETLEQFEKLFSNTNLFYVIEMAYKEGYHDGRTDECEVQSGGRAREKQACWDNSDTKATMMKAIRRLNGSGEK